jgi:hypothetical protein
LGVTKRQTKDPKSTDAPKAPLDVVSAAAALRKPGEEPPEHQLCHLDSERASKLRKRPTRY